MGAGSNRVQRTSEPAPRAGGGRSGRLQRAVSDLAMRTGATLGLGGPAQPKMEVSRPQDALERQADRTADTVMRSSAPAGEAECIPCAQNPRDLQRAAATPEPPIQRQADVPEPPIQRAAAVPEPPIQRAATSGAPPAVPPKTAALIRSPGPGKPIPPDVRQRVEPGVGADLSGVRVHDGPAAAGAAMSIQAKAFTHGPNIFLGPRQSSRDVRLMAHESAHVVQQGAAVQRTANDQPVQRTADDQVQRAAVEDQAQRAPAEEQVQRACAPCDEGIVQRAVEPTVQRLSWSDITGAAGAAWNAAGELVDAAGNVIEMGAEIFWKLAQKVLPDGVLQIINEIRSQGIVGYLSSHLRTVFNAIFGGLRGDNSALGGLVDAFDAVLAAAPAIVEALKAGDCQPLFSAVSQLGEALGKVAGEAWDAIAAFFRPIGDFFSELWASFGAPVVDWLVKYAKDQWEAFKKLGQMLWDLTQPVRDELMAAWTWLKNQLGIGEGEEGQNGILQWVQTKAGEAWDAIKAELQPIIGPMQAVVDKIKAVLPITAILNLRETVRGWLSGVQGMVGNLQQPQGVVANQDTLRSEILPAVRASILGLRGSLTGAGAWIAAEIGGLVTTVTGFLDSLRSNSILSAAAGLFDWIGAGVTRLGAWAQATVGSLVSFLSDGLGKLSEFIEPVLNTLQKVVAVLGDVIGELPGLVLGPFWRMIPECIREPIKNFIIEHILKNIPIINKFLEIPDIWGKIQALVIDLLKRIFVHGDLSGAAMAVIRFVLEAAGVNVDLLLGVIAKAAASLEDIIMDPVKFLGNLFAAMKQGLDQFLTNIGQHLINGLLTWMLGPLADLGIKIPTELSLASVFDLVLQILGITGAKLRQKAEKVIGKTAVKVLEQAWKYISALIEGGPAKLWEEIQNQLSNLWSAVIGGITSWISMEVVEAGIAWIAKLSNPVGAVIEAIRQIYNVVRFVVEQANKIIAFADAVVSSLSKIVSGEIGGAANWIESALGRTVPLVIDFLAGLVGISSPSPHIRKIVVKIQGTVDKALDWLVEKAKAIGQGLLNALGFGGGSAEGIDESITFTAGEESHRAWIETSGTEATLMIASDTQTIQAFLDREDVKTATEKDPGPTHLGEAKRLLTETKADSKTLLEEIARQRAAQAQASAGPASTVTEGDKKTEVREDLKELVGHLVWIVEAVATLYKGHPKVNTYDNLEGTVKDYSPHHVPPKGLASWIWHRVQTIPDDIKTLAFDPATETAALNGFNHQKGGGGSLSTILLHKNTHISLTGDPVLDAYRAHHGKGTAELVAEKMKTMGPGGTPLTPIRKGDKPLTPDEAAEAAEHEVEGGPDVDVGMSSTQFYKPELDAALQAVKREQKDGIQGYLASIRSVFFTAWLQSRANVEVSLTYSLGKDGPAKNFPTAIQDLGKLARHSWRKMYGNGKEADNLTQFD